LSTSDIQISTTLGQCAKGATPLSYQTQIKSELSSPKHPQDVP